MTSAARQSARFILQGYSDAVMGARSSCAGVESSGDYLVARQPDDAVSKRMSGTGFRFRKVERIGMGD
jgi:hypothetical protein